MHLFSFAEKLWIKSIAIFQQPGAWLAGIGLFIINALTRGKIIIYLVVIACVVDLICGIAVSIKKGEFTRSELSRLTVEKLLVYGCVMLVFLCIDEALANKVDFEISLTSTFVGIIITLTEGVSFTASLLILFPKNPLLRMLQGALKSELASKLNIEKEKVDEYFEGLRQKKAQNKKTTKGNA